MPFTIGTSDGKFYEDEFALAAEEMGGPKPPKPVDFQKPVKDVAKAVAPKLSSLVAGEPERPIISPDQVPVGSKIPPADDPRITTAMGEVADVVGGFLGGPGGAAKTMPALIIGAGAKTWPSKLAAKAEEALSKGVSKDSVYDVSGLYRGTVDKKLRTEINDLNLKYDKLPESGAKKVQVSDTPEGPVTKTNIWDMAGDDIFLLGDIQSWEGKLSEVIKHTELFKAYPEVKDFKVQFVGKSNPIDVEGTMYAAGTFSPAKKTIIVHDTPIKGELMPHHINTILHEVQHWIQQKEGFTLGANYATSLDLLETKLTEFAGKTKDPKELDIIKNFAKLLVSKKNDRDFLTDTANTAYLRQAGEVEARNVAGRFADPERTRKAPYKTEDVPADIQLDIVPYSWR